MNTSVAKEGLRQKFRQLFFRDSLSEKITYNLIECLKTINPRNDQTIGGFLPLKNEAAPDFNSLFQTRNFSWGFPFLKNNRMYFTRVDKMSKGPWVEQEKEILNPKILIVPGLAFSPKGTRLGRGKGFYDRYIEEHHPLTIGITTESRLVEKLPSENHDKRMDYLITEKRILNLRRT